MPSYQERYRRQNSDNQIMYRIQHRVDGTLSTTTDTLTSIDSNKRPTTNETPLARFIELTEKADFIFYAIETETINDHNDFKVFHCLISEIIDKWVKGYDNTKHPFYMKWKRWTFYGLNHHKDFKSVRAI
mmetsp:Transcript_21327/g.30492  ORF Transcript_21327/g.30492 Transcript_21327/m.30492 type:complete len:130 (+) Transcript_21327:36-425(+)